MDPHTSGYNRDAISLFPTSISLVAKDRTETMREFCGRSSCRSGGVSGAVVCDVSVLRECFGLLLTTTLFGTMQTQPPIEN